MRSGGSRLTRSRLAAPMILASGLIFCISTAPLHAEHVLAPPEPPPVMVRPAGQNGEVAGSRVQQPYSHGDPSDAEQYMLELINRARLNPSAEGLLLATTTDPQVLSAYSFFGVNKEQLKTDFEAYPARPPLAFNAKLIAAARGHSQDMATNNFQGHAGTSGSTPSDRVTAAGYNWTAMAENVYAYAKSIFHGHCAFNVDWGVPTLGHRKNIMNYQGIVFQEIGLGVVPEENEGTPVGPLVITQNFGTAGTGRFLVGVVYQDQNGNGFYDPGEGLSGVTITPASGAYFAVTSSSGGYALPIASSGSLTVTASGGALAQPLAATVTLAGMNVKLDFPASGGNVTPPVITSSAAASGTVGASFSYTIVASGDPVTFSANGLPAGLSLNAATGVISGVPATAGTTVVSLGATNSAGTGTLELTITLSEATQSPGNRKPKIVSSAQAVPNPTATGQPVAFSVTANDPDGDTLTYVWNFGDGTFGAGSAPAHTYTVPGVYSVQVKISDGEYSITGGLAVLVMTPGASGGTVSKAAVSLNFSKPRKDTISLQGTLPLPPAFVPAGKPVNVKVGTFELNFFLNAKGKAVSGSFKLAGKLQGGAYVSSPVKFSLSAKNLELLEHLQPLGFENQNAAKTLMLPVIVRVDETSYSAAPVLKYSARENKAGTGRLVSHKP